MWQIDAKLQQPLPLPQGKTQREAGGDREGEEAKEVDKRKSWTRKSDEKRSGKENTYLEKRRNMKENSRGFN